MTYDVTVEVQIATGHNNSGSLAAFTRTPLQVGLQPPPTVLGGTGRRIRLGRFTAIITWGRVPYGTARLVLNEVGFTDDGAADALVTLYYAGNEDRTAAGTYNAIVDYPETWRGRLSGWDDLTLVFRDLEAI